jgi:hypothetical protein
MINGHCECGRIQFEVNGDVKDFSHCHCSQCRRLHGAAYATFAGVTRDDFRYTSGEDHIKVYASSPSHDRAFCSVCGSNILVHLVEDEPDSLYLSMSTIEGNPPLPVGYHIFVGSKAPWHEITDNLAQYETDPAD